MTQKKWDEMIQTKHKSEAIYKIGVVIAELSCLSPKGEKKNRNFSTWIKFNVEILKDAQKELQYLNQ